MDDPAADYPPSSSPIVQSRSRAAWAPWITAVLLVAAAAALYWNWQQAHSPARTVERCGEAIKNGDWKTVYGLIAWGEGAAPRVDESMFVVVATGYGRLYHLKSLKVGIPKVSGSDAAVPVTATVQINELLSSSTRTSSATVRCRAVNGQWKILPDLDSGLLGFTRPN